MRFRLSLADYRFIEKYAADAVALFSDLITSEDYCEFYADYDTLLVELTYAVLDAGMDDEDTVNNVGKRLYGISAELTAQAKKTA